MDTDVVGLYYCHLRSRAQSIAMAISP